MTFLDLHKQTSASPAARLPPSRREALRVCLSSPQDGQEKNANPVQAEEAKLKAKYPSLAQRPGGSDFLMKRLQKGVSVSQRLQHHPEAQTHVAITNKCRLGHVMRRLRTVGLPDCNFKTRSKV